MKALVQPIGKPVYYGFHYFPWFPKQFEIDYPYFFRDRHPITGELLDID